VAEGHPGRTTVLDDPIEGKHKNSLRVLQAVLESHRPLDVVVIMLGTNDLKARFGMLASDVALGVQRVAGEILRSDCGRDGAAPSVLIVAPVSVTETGVFTEIFAGAQEKSQDLPRHLSQVAEALCVPFADTNIVARTDPTDGIHLDEQAHIAIGQYLAAQVSAM
jgi:lysophospholipase L1-like esterase